MTGPIRSFGLLVCAIAVACVGAATATAAPAQRAFALSDGHLLAFDPATPGTTTSTTITGVVAGETLVGIDTRPQNGMLYGLGVNATADTATLYVIGRETGFAGVAGAASGVAFTTDGVTPVDLPAAGYGFDVNPVADRIRVTTASGLNFRLNPNTGAPVDGDAVTAGINPDAAINGSLIGGVSGSAYTNDRPTGTAVTTLYSLNAATDQLTIQNPPNNGTQTLPQDVTVGGTPLNFSAVGGFDIDPAVSVAASNSPVTSGVGYATLTVGATTRLYAIDLVTGAATEIGPIGDGTGGAQGLALQRDLDDAGFPVVALDGAGANLVRFQTATPATTTSVAVTGVTVAETLVGVAWRPQTGQFYGLGVNPVANTATLYLMDPAAGTATAIGVPGAITFTTDGLTAVDLPIASAGWGFDFNPTVDRLRVTAGGGLSFRVNPVNGAPVDGNNGVVAAGVNPDGTITAPGVTAVSYTNAFTQALTGPATTLYALRPISNELVIVNPPNAGTVTTPVPVTLGGASLDFGIVAGLDVPGEVAVATSNVPAAGSAITLMDIGGVDHLYALDLATGAATLLGTPPTSIASIAVGDAQRDTAVPASPPPPPPPPAAPAAPAPPPAAPVAPAQPKDTARPTVSKLTITAARKRRLTISFTASEAGRATIRLLRETRGRLKGKKTCVAGRKSGRPCTIRTSYGSLTTTVTKAGKVTITVNGKVGAKRLATGAIRVEVTMVDGAANTSALVARSAKVRR